MSLSASSWSSRPIDPMQREVPSLRGAITASHPSMIPSEAPFCQFTPSVCRYRNLLCFNQLHFFL